MIKRPFADSKAKPDDESLRAALGDAFGFYAQILAATGTWPREWAFSKHSGWMLKVHDKRKALLYLIPLDGGLRLSLTLRESERAQLMADRSLTGLHRQIGMARKYSEGYALVFEVRGDGDLGPFAALLGKLIAVREA